MELLYSIETLLLFSITLYLLYKYISRNNDYWKRKGVPFIEPTFFFGNYYDILTFKKSIGIALKDIYDTLSKPYFGIWIFSKPTLIVKDPELIKNMLIKDFKYFNDRTVASNEHADQMTAYMLFILRNPEWRTMRAKITPAFTSGKIKGMMPHINEVAEELTKYLRKLTSQNEVLEAKEICAKYSTDIITSCAFGVQGNSFKDHNAPWRKVGRDMFEFTISNGIRGASYFFLPGVVDFFKLKFILPHITTFLREAFWQTISKRESHNETRNDLIDIIIKLKKEGDFDGIKFEGDKVVAQAVQFFLAGFETTSSTIAFALYELSLNKSVQNELVAEIKATIEENGGITYDAVQNMKYLHKIVQEILRKYPVLPFLDRMCVMDYKIPGTDLVLEKGTPVYIPMFGLHYDPQYYPNPTVFDPERFSEENINSRPQCAHIPFGTGPRSCIGERFGLITSKIALVHILSQFEVEKCSTTPVPIKFEPKTFVIASTVGLPLKFIERSTRKEAQSF